MPEAQTRNIEATHLLSVLARGGQYAYLWRLEGKRSQWRAADEIPPEVSGQSDVYFGVHPTRCLPSTNAAGEARDPAAVRGRLEIIAAINCLFAELDGKEFDGGDPRGRGLELALARLNGITPPPSAIIASGGGYHAYWFLREPRALDTPEALEGARSLQARWVGYVGGDEGSKDLARVLRVPGTVNSKYPDRPIVQVIAYYPDCTYSPEELFSVLPPIPRPAARVLPAPQAGPEDVAERALRMALGKGTIGTGAVTGFWLACQLRDNGCEEARALATLNTYALQVHQDPSDPFTERHALGWWKSANSRPAREPWSAPAPVREPHPFEADEVVPEAETPTGAPTALPEERVLGALLKHRSCRDAVLAKIERADFPQPAERMVFHAIDDLCAQKKPVTVETVSAELIRRQQLDRVGGAPYLSRLVERASDAESVLYWAEAQLHAAIQRRLLCALKDATTQAQEPGRTSGVLQMLEGEISAIRERSQGKGGDQDAITAAELWAKDIPPAVCVIDGLVYEGLNLLVGPSKIGKSWLAFAWAIAAATGGRALGRFPAMRSDVLYLALEDGQRRLKDRLVSMHELDPAFDPRQLTGVHFRFRWPQIGDGCAEAIERWLDEHPQGRMIIVDVFQKIRPPSRRNAGNAYQEDYQVMGPLQELATRRKVAILLVHHTNKTVAEDAFDSVSGSTGIMGSADATLLLRRPRGEEMGTLQVTGRDIEERKLALKFDRGLWVCEGDAEAVERTALEQAAIDAIMGQGNQPLPVTTLANMMGKTRTATYNLLGRMRQKGIVTPQDGGKYCVSEYYLMSTGGMNEV